MKWDEFSDLLTGISPDTALGRIVAIRAETNKDRLKHFSKEERRIRNEWLSRRAKAMKKDDLAEVLEALKQGFIQMAGGGQNCKDKM